jgi:hypothetical protein
MTMSEIIWLHGDWPKVVVYVTLILCVTITYIGTRKT